jgi:hypothetical protein
VALNMLLSFAFYATDDIGAYREVMPCGRLMIDSGAFTAMSVGKSIDLMQYAEFLTTWHDAIDHAITLDVIGDPKATGRNTRKLHDMGHNVMPVFTRGGSVAEFDAMVKDSGYVCVGGSVGLPTPIVINRLKGLQQRAEGLGGGIHALGVGSMNVLRRIRPYSADASNVSSTFRFGTLVCYDGRELRVFPHRDRKRVRKHLSHLRAQGLSVTELLRVGMQPKGLERFRMMQGLSVSYACADEDSVSWCIPAPHSTVDTVGAHMYSSITGGHLAPATAGLDLLLHDPGWSVPMWERYRTRHVRQCRVVPQAEASPTPALARS